MKFREQLTEKGSAIFYLSSKLQSENYYFEWCTNLKIPTIYRKCSNCDGINISQMTIFEVGQIIIEEQRVQLDGAQKGRKRERGREGERKISCAFLRMATAGRWKA